MRMISYILMLFLLGACNNKEHNDLIEYAYKGKVKTMVEVYQLNDRYGTGKPNQPIKTNYYYSPVGALTKVEKYNLVESGKLLVNYVATYSRKNGRPAEYKAVNRKGKPEESGTYHWEDDQHYTLRIDMGNKLRSENAFVLDDEGRMQQRTMQIFNDTVRKLHLITDLIYNDSGEIIRTRQHDPNGGQDVSTGIYTAARDAMGNGTLLYYIDEKRMDTVGKVERTFTYYR